MRSSIAGLAGALAFALACGGGPSAETDAETSDETASTEAAPKPRPLTLAEWEAQDDGEDDEEEGWKGPVWMVITSTSTTRAEAEAHAARHEELKLPIGVEVYATDDVEGLKPGLFVTSPVHTADEASAKVLAKRLDPHFEGTYVREVRFAEAEPARCDIALRDRRCVALDGRYRALLLISPPGESGSEDWYHYADQVERFVGGTWAVDVVDAKRDGPTTVHLGEEPAAEVDVTAFFERMPGYVAVEQGKETVFITHGLADGVIAEAEAYFELDLPQPMDLAAL